MHWTPTAAAREPDLGSGSSKAFDGIHGFVGATEESGSVFVGSMFDDADGGPDGHRKQTTVESDFVTTFKELKDFSATAKSAINGAMQKDDEFIASEASC